MSINYLLLLAAQQIPTSLEQPIANTKLKLKDSQYDLQQR
jgi:hypothetical protein